MNKTIKIFAPLSTDWGVVMQRITYDFQRNAPDWVKFVNTYEEADMVFWHILAPRDLPKDKPCLIFFHCFGLDEGEQIMSGFVDMFRQAKMVYSYYPLEKFLPTMEGINYMRRPWGVDANLFYKMPEVKKTYTCLATGYVASTEAIMELYRACEAVNGKLLHVGGPLDAEVGVLNPIFYERVIGLTDDDMRRAYNSCHWTSALRRHEGFELPAIEGLLCGSQPICFDIPDFYNHWFSDFATFIPHASVGKVTEELIKLFKTTPLISQDKIDKVKEEFNVNKLAGEFWQEFNKII